MGRSDFLYSGFVSGLRHEPTSCQDSLNISAAEIGQWGKRQTENAQIEKESGLGQR